MIDTRHFAREFTLKLLASIENLDASLDGVCFHADNFQALQLMTETFKDRVRSVYLDPPFNLGANGDFLYKTDYKDSSWACLLHDRLLITKPLVTALGFVFVRCDINGNFIARPILNNVFGSDNFHAELLVQRIRKNVTTQGKLTIPLANDSLFLFQRTGESELVNPFLKLKETRQSYWRRMDDSAGFRNPPERIIFGRKLFPYKTDAHFKFSQSNVDEMSSSGRVRLRCKGCGFEHLSGQWNGCAKCGVDEPVAQYLVEETDVKILDTNWLDIAGYSHTTGFSTENSEVLLCRAIEATSQIGEWVLDFFGGSGTTAAASLKIGRRFISVEAGDHNEGILVPRLKKVAMASKKTEAGKEGDERTGIFKIVRLEGYEDTLNNLHLSRTPEQEAALAKGGETVRRQYLLSYFLDVESAGSKSLLDLTEFRDPFAYKLAIATSSAGETKETTVDLVETFNWLLGLKVKHIDTAKGFLTVTGEKRAGGRCLIVWRTLSADSKADNESLEKFLTKLAVNPGDTEFEFIYVNGAHTLNDPHNKVHLIEETFQRLMFDTTNFESLS
jgi:adenine-specific DNA-methyltransferase